MIACFVHEHGRRSAVRKPLVTPAHKRNECRRQRNALSSQPILVTRWTVAIQVASEDIVLDEPLEPFGEHGSSNIEVPPKLVEATNPTKRVSQNQNSPTIAEDIQARLNRATFHGFGGHYSRIVGQFLFRTKSVLNPNPLCG